MLLTSGQLPRSRQQVHAPFEAVWLRPQPAIRDFLMMNGQAQSSLVPALAAKRMSDSEADERKPKLQDLFPRISRALCFLSG